MMDSHDTKLYKVDNIAGLNPSELKNDIQYLLFVENENLFPMSELTKLEPVIDQLANLIIVHADAGVRQKQHEIVYAIASQFKEEAANIVYHAVNPDMPTIALPKHEEPDDGLYSW